MKKLLLINPVGRRSGYLLSKFTTFPPLNLAYVAAVTPENWEIKLIDENFAEFEYEEADLVGLTAFSSSVNRAYEIADIYRKNKISVVIGGIHASMLPDEALQYADAVVIGEVEGIWHQVLNDFEKNSLQGKYSGPRVDLENYGIKPRRDLFSSDYLWQPVQTSRGCPFNCNFCSVSKYLGKEYRQRKADDVLAEIAEIDSPYIAFVDDNMIGYNQKSKKRAAEIYRGMFEQGMKKKWWMQTSINAAADKDLIALASASGCMAVFIGFETTDNDTLKQMKKGVNLKTGVKHYNNVIKAFHKHSIGVYGAFIIGNDYESPAYYKALASFLVHSGIDIIQITLLTPLPGTELMKKMEDSESLIFHDFPKDWDKYRFSYVVHKSIGIDEDTIYTGDNYIKKRIYTFPRYQYRLLKSLVNLNKLGSFFAVYKFNKVLKKAWENSQYYQKYPHKFE